MNFFHLIILLQEMWLFNNAIEKKFIWCSNYDNGASTSTQIKEVT